MMKSAQVYMLFYKYASEYLNKPFIFRIIIIYYKMLREEDDVTLCGVLNG